ncbi:protein S100-A4-like isoform X2 [Hyperolius riggenbachi]|uniref:protein S100-A4-like isoform X2 n=1 Tax=Hyperolius riggenbachi TaxID=752182 RepID=UPI0035A38402
MATPCAPQSGTIENMMFALIKKFDFYAKGDGDGSSLNQDELCKLAEKEFPSLCTSNKKDEILKSVIGKMDMDGDKKVTFDEYMIFLSCLAMILHEHSK